MVEVGDQVELHRPTVVTLRAVTVIVCVCVCVCVHSVAKSCLSLWDPMDCSLPGSSVHGISQVRILKWVAISFSRDHPRSGIKSSLLHWQADSLPPSYHVSPGDSHEKNTYQGLSPCPHPLPLLHPGRCSPARLVLYHCSFCQVMAPSPLWSS